MRILVIDDNRDTARMIAMLLERRFSANIDIQPSCADARVALANNSYDVITLDYQLPDCSGLDMLDGTPVLDVKPYLSNIPGAKLRRGWLVEAEAARRTPGTGA